MLHQNSPKFTKRSLVHSIARAYIRGWGSICDKLCFDRFLIRKNTSLIVMDGWLIDLSLRIVGISRRTDMNTFVYHNDYEWCNEIRFLHLEGLVGGFLIDFNPTLFLGSKFQGKVSGLTI